MTFRVTVSQPCLPIIFIFSVNTKWNNIIGMLANIKIVFPQILSINRSHNENKKMMD